jgi:hypothetical protein
MTEGRLWHVRHVPDMPRAPGEAAPKEVIAGLRAANGGLRELLAERDVQLAEKDTRIGALEAQLEELATQVADLVARVRQNSGNSSKPPSSDGLGKSAPKSLRKKTGGRPGRPKGQPGVTMRLTDHPDHWSGTSRRPCRTCGTGLKDARETGVERRQASEIPPATAGILEHQMIERECPCCGERTKAEAPDG